MIIDIETIKKTYSKNDIDELKYDIKMMSLNLPAFNYEEMQTWANYKKVLKEYERD